MDTSETPHRPPEAPDERAQRPPNSEPTSPSPHLQRHKRKKTSDAQPPPTIDLTGKEPAAARLQTDITRTAVSSYLNKIEYQNRVKKQVIQDLASWLDTFADNYAGEHQADHRSQARDYITKLANYLNSVAFTATTATLHEPNKEQGACAPNSKNANKPDPKSTTWADVARSGHTSKPTENNHIANKRKA